MKKIVLLALMTLQLFAYDDYIGLGVGYSQFKVGTPTGEIDNNGMSATMNFGHKYQDYGRFHASATYINHDDNINSAGIYSLGYDFLFPVMDDTLELYVGPVLGYTSYEETNFSLSGLHYGIEVGMLVEITDNIELELGYNFLNQDKSTATHIAKNTQTAYFGVNFFFDKTKYFKYE